MALKRIIKASGRIKNVVRIVPTIHTNKASDGSVVETKGPPHWEVTLSLGTSAVILVVEDDVGLTPGPVEITLTQTDP